MQIPDLTNLLQRYTNASASNPPPNVTQDFQQVAQNAPSTHLANGLADAFRSDQTPPFGQMIGNLFGNSNDQQRAGILNQLIGAAGPGLLSSGLLGGLSGMLRSGGSQPQVTPEQARQVSPEAVQQIAEHAHQQNPSIIEQASNFYAQHPTLVQSLGAGSLALIMSRMSRS
ncbi:MAG: hypothetical protein ACR2NN_28845 [Bryobacteraceae bacterium]